MEYVRFNRNGGTTRHQTHSASERVDLSLVDDDGNVVTEKHTFRDKRVRTGKTRRDHNSGAWARRLANRQNRSGN